MGQASNVSNDSQINGAHNAGILPDNFDAMTLKDFFKGLVENAQPGDRNALKGLIDDLKGLADATSGDRKVAGHDLFDRIFAINSKSINQNLVPFLETLANNPGAFGQDLPAGMNIHETMDAIVENSPASLKPLMQEFADDIKDLTKGFSGISGEQGDDIAALMTYLVNKGNDIAADAAPGTAIGGVSGGSPNGVSPDNIVPDNGDGQGAMANTVTKAAEALALVSKMLGDPAQMTKENMAKLVDMTRDIAADAKKLGAGEKPAMEASEAAAGAESGETSSLGKIQQYLSDLLQSLLRQLQKDDGTKESGGGKATGGAKAGGAAGAAGAEGGAAGGAEGAEGGAEGAAEAGGSSEATSAGGSEGSGGLSVFEVIAKALGDKMTTKLKEMRTLANEISSLSDSGADSTAIAGQSAKLSAASQEFSLLSNTFSTTIKALGEGTKAAVRYS